MNQKGVFQNGFDLNEEDDQDLERGDKIAHLKATKSLSEELTDINTLEAILQREHGEFIGNFVETN